MVDADKPEYAASTANGSYDWYRRAAIRSRRLYRFSEVAIIGISTLVPLSAVVFSNNVVLPAVLGSAVVVVTGFRSAFHWHENYLRFSRAREAIEAERRKYHVGVPPYADQGTRDAALVEAVTKIEQDEMGKWLQLAPPSSVARDTLPPVER